MAVVTMTAHPALLTLIAARCAQLTAVEVARAHCRQRLLVLAVTRIYARVYLYQRWMSKLDELEEVA